MAMYYDSFEFNGVNMLEKYGIKILEFDVLYPQARERKVLVPQRPGKVDYGSHGHEERTLRMECTIERALSQDEFDDLKYLLSQKGRIRTWQEPNRVFRGQCFEAPEVIDSFSLFRRDFTLNFICEPYKYATKPVVILTADPNIIPNYKGTAKTPARIRIKNHGSSTLRDIRIVQRRRID